jgi:hypothetical protein
MGSVSRKAAIESLDGDLRTAGDLETEPVSSSSVGAWFAPLLAFSSANTPNTRIPAITMLSTVERPERTRRAETMFRISEYPIPRNACGVPQKGNFTCSRLTDYFVIGALSPIPSIGSLIRPHRYRLPDAWWRARIWRT